MSHRSALIAVALALLVAAAVALWALRSPVLPAVQLGYAPLVRTLQFSARVATASRVDVGSTVTGRVSRVAVKEGAAVRQGEVLLQLESDELRAALQQAQASERQSAARLAGLRSTGRSAALAGVAQADSVLRAARADLKRTQDLVAQGFLSAARLDEAQSAVAVAQAQQDSARALSTAIADQGTEVVQAQAQLALATSAVAAAQARLAQAVITAPADAKVLTRLVEPGQIVQPGRALMSLALSGPLQLVAQVDERFLEQLQIGQTASVLADAFPAQRFMAQVQSIAPLVDAQRGAIELKFSLPQQPPAFLREDMTLSVEVETARRERALVLPMSALRGGLADDQAEVRLERGGRVEARQVRLGLRTLDAVEVLQGLAEGDLLLAGSVGAVRDGTRVRVATPVAAQAGVTPETASAHSPAATGSAAR